MTVAASSGRLRTLPIVPDPSRWYLAAVVAAMAFLAVLAGIGLIAVGDARGDWNVALGTTLTLELPSDTSPPRLEVVLAMLRQTQGVTGAEALDAAETARLLEPWLGKSVPVDILPLPRLVAIRIDGGGAVDLDGLRQRLKSVAPEAQLDDHRLWLAKLLAASSRLQAIAAAMLAAAAAVAAASAAFSAGNGFARNGERIALLHALGAQDRDIAARFVLSAAATGLAGGVLGGLAGAGVWATIAGMARSLDAPSFAPMVTDRPVLLLIAAVMLASALIAAGTAALVVRRHLLRLP